MIAVITTTGNTIHPGTAADIVAMNRVTPLHELIHAMEISNGDLCDRLIGAIESTLHVPAITRIGLAEADMRFPPDAFTRLKAHGKDIVAANYWQRQQRKWAASMSGSDGVSSAGKTGLQRVLSCGCGVMLISKWVLSEMPLPWFSRPWIPHQREHMKPDTYFCTHAGVEVWVDHDLSQAVAHVGEVSFGVTATRYATTGIIV
jgi:hypothetical protein